MPPVSGLVSWWPGDGDARDFVGGADATYTGAYPTGIVGQAFSLTSPGPMPIPDRPSLNPTNAITLEAWVRASGGGGGSYFNIISKDGESVDRQYILSIGPYGKFRAQVGVPSLVYFDGQTAVQPNVWYHVAMTYDQVDLRLYVNGALDGSTPASGPILVTPEPLRLGGGSPYTPYYFVLVDEAALYNRALSASEVQAIYDAGANGKCKTPFPPTIASQPVGQTQLAGANVLFSVGAIGTPPLIYQWAFNGTNLGTAIGSSLSLTNVQTRDAGIYTVMVSNSVAAVTSSPASLVVNRTAPLLGFDVSNRVAIPGTPVSLAVFAYGTDPLSFQWSFNGTNLPGATNSFLTFDSVEITNAGRYRVTVTNFQGSVTSRVATLTVMNYPRPSTIVAWGDNTYDRTNPPITETNVVAVAAGSAEMMLRKDGVLSCFGSLLYGPGIPAAAIQAIGLYGLLLGFDGKPTAFGLTGLSGASDVPDYVTNAVAIAIGSPRIALKDDGTVMGWRFPTPVDRWGLGAAISNLSGIAAIAMRDFHGLALTSNHAVIAFGTTDNGLRDVPPGINNAVAVAAGAAHHLVLKSDGTVVGWGDNSVGEVNIPAGLSGVVAISAGDYHSLALKSDGTVVAWGDNTYGQCNVPVGLSNVTFISAGLNSSLALTKQPRVSTFLFSTTVPAGTNVSFSVFSTGYAPLSYQWMHEGANIPGATNVSLNLTNVPLNAAGSYQCLVTNAFGSALSGTATLVVLRLTPRFDSTWSQTHSSNGSFGLMLNSLSGHGNIIIESSSNLLNWERIFTNPPVLGSFQYFDSTVVPSRFYRAFEQ